MNKGYAAAENLLSVDVPLELVFAVGVAVVAAAAVVASAVAVGVVDAAVVA